MSAQALIVALLLGLSSFTHATEITIFDMRKSLSMSEQDPSYRDFYINRGSDAGLRPGMVITVTRRIPLYDSYQNRSAGDLRVNVGRVKIVHTQPGLSVARLFDEMSRENQPLLEDNFIMVGDELDLASATSEAKAKGKAAQTDDGAGEPVAPQKPVSFESKRDTASAQEFAVDFASKAPDKSSTKGTVDVPVMR